MKTKFFFYLFIACTLPLIACGVLQAGITTQTAVAGTTVAASWTETPTMTLTPTPSPTFTPTETPIPTATPDLCLPENLRAAVEEVVSLQTQFDSLSGAAANVEREQLPDRIAELQRLLETATEQYTPPCLVLLRDYQVRHMNYVIDTLNAFADGAGDATINTGIRKAREQHNLYLLELADLLGGTLTPTP